MGETTVCTTTIIFNEGSRLSLEVLAGGSSHKNKHIPLQCKVLYHLAHFRLSLKSHQSHGLFWNFLIDIN